MTLLHTHAHTYARTYTHTHTNAHCEHAAKWLFAFDKNCTSEFRETFLPWSFCSKSTSNFIFFLNLFLFKRYDFTESENKLSLCHIRCLWCCNCFDNARRSFVSSFLHPLRNLKDERSLLLEYEILIFNELILTFLLWELKLN